MGVSGAQFADQRVGADLADRLGPGEAGVRNLLELIEKEMRVAMVLTGAKSIGEISADSLVRELGA